jgi:hypothetical protein
MSEACRVARFYSVQYTQNEKIYQKIYPNVFIGHKIYQMAIKYTNGHKIYPIRQNCHKNINIFHCKAFQNLPKMELLV